MRSVLDTYSLRRQIAHLDRVALVGLEIAGAWAAADGLLHIVPYFGPAITTAGIGMATFMQFDALTTPLVTIGVSLFVATINGIFVAPWMTGRIASQ